MAGKADHPSTGGTGRTEGRPTPARGRGARSHATSVPIGIDSAAPISDPQTDEAIVAVAAPLPPDVLPRKIRTQACYRQLVSSGLSGAEAAGLIGYVSGLSSSVGPWSLNQVNRMLFLRALYLGDRLGQSGEKPGRLTEPSKGGPSSCCQSNTHPWLRSPLLRFETRVGRGGAPTPVDAASARVTGLRGRLSEHPQPRTASRGAFTQRRASARPLAGIRKRPKEPSRCVGLDVISATSSRSTPSGVMNTLRKSGAHVQSGYPPRYHFR